MSCSYAEGLSEYHDKGKLGLPEKFDVSSDIIGKVNVMRAVQHSIMTQPSPLGDDTHRMGEKCSTHRGPHWGWNLNFSRNSRLPRP